MSDLTDLTSRQQEIYEFITKAIESMGYPPTIRDIGNHFEIKSPNGVMCHLKALEKKGFITREGKSARAIQLTHKPASPASIPFLGVVAAGLPLPAVEQTEERLDLQTIFPGGDKFALKVQGRSMIDANIQDGDYVVIKPQATAQNGEQVVAMVDGEVTLKIFQKKKDHIQLVPANGEMSPIVVDPSKDVRIVGVLIGVIRVCA